MRTKDFLNIPLLRSEDKPVLLLPHMLFYMLEATLALQTCQALIRRIKLHVVIT